MKRIIVFIGILLLAVAGVSYLYFSSLQRKRTGFTQLIQSVPADALLAYSFSNEKEYDDLFRNSSLFTSVTGPKTSGEWKSLKNFITQKKVLKQAFAGAPVVLSLHADSVRQQLNWMLSTALPATLSWQDMLTEISRYGKLTEAKGLYVLRSAQLGAPLYFTRKGSIVALGYSAVPLGSFMLNNSETSFSLLADQQNRNALAGLAVNYRMFPALQKMAGKNSNNLLFALFPKISGSSATTITYNREALLFNGTTYQDEDDHETVSFLKGQDAVMMDIDRVLPAETFAYAAMGISNYPRFLFKVDSMRKQDFGAKKQALLQQQSFPLGFFMKQQFAGEFAVALMPNGGQMAFVKIRNGARLKQYFISMSENDDDSDINRFRYENFPEAFFGAQMRTFKRPYFTVNGEYLIMANSYTALSRYLLQKQNNRLLAANDVYMRSRSLMSDRSNFTFFALPENGTGLLRQQMRPAVYDFISDDEKPSWHDYESMAFQLSADGGSFYTNILLKQGNVKPRDEQPVWEYNLGASLLNEPLVLPGSSNTSFIALEDAAHRLTLLNDSGKKVWQKQLRGRIQGSIQQLGNDLFFNTTLAVYRIHLDGEDAPGYPLSLPFQATAALTRFNGYFSVPMGNRFFAYSETSPGEPVWENTLNGSVRFPAKLMPGGSLAALTQSGRLYIIGRDGAVLSENTIKPASSFPYDYAVEQPAADSARMITANRGGEIYMIKTSGQAKVTTPGVFANDVTFGCENILGDTQPELIYLDRKQLIVYDTNFNQVYNYLFQKPVKASIRIIRDRAKKMIGIVSARGNQVYLFNPDGSLAKGYPRKGGTRFWSGDLYRSGQGYMITGTGNSVKAYLTE